MTTNKSEAANKLNKLSKASNVPFTVENVGGTGMVTFQLNPKEKLDDDDVEKGTGEDIASFMGDLYDTYTPLDVDTHFSGIRIKALLN